MIEICKINKEIYKKIDVFNFQNKILKYAIDIMMVDMISLQYDGTDTEKKQTY